MHYIMKLKSSIIFSLVMILLGYASARPVDEATARTVASHFFASQYNLTSETLSPQIAYTASSIRDGKGTTPSFYVVNFNNDGFVIVAGDDRVQPILAFSDEGAFVTENMPEHIRFFLDGYSEDIQHIIDNQQNTDETILQQWEALLSGDIPAQKDGDMVVGPLLGNNRWNQTKYYNDLCPEDASGNAAYGGPELPDAIGEHCLETLNVYPNPSNGIVHISAESQPVSELQVFDIFGKMLFHKSVGEREFSVDLSNYSAGTYILRLVTDKGVETRKIVKY